MVPVTSLETAYLAGKAGREFLAETPCIADLFKARADTAPDSDAIRFYVSAAGDEFVGLTFGQLYRRILSTAGLLAKLGVAQDDAVAILLPAIPEAHMALWGAMTAGIANPMNTLLTREAIAGQLKGAGAKVLIAFGPHPAIDIWQRVRGLEGEVETLETIIQVDSGNGVDPEYPIFADLLAATDPSDFKGSSDPQRIAALFHTGGTTGSPKIVQLTHRNLVAAAWSTVQSYAFSDKDVIINGLPLFHVGGAIDAGLSPLAAGSCIAIPTIGGMRNPQLVQGFWNFVERTGTTIIAMVPTSFAAAVNVPVGQADLSRLSLAICGGSPIPVEIARRFELMSGVRVHELFGMTECCGIATCNPRGGKRRLGSSGLPIPMIEIAIDTAEGRETLDQLPTKSGEILIRGPNVFQGYRDPAHNQGVVLADGWVATGDLGQLDEDGFLWITGRKKDLIIRSGHNIDPQSIENVAIGCPGVAVAAAVGQPDDYAGEVPVLFVVAAPNAEVSAQEVLAFVAARIEEPPAKPRTVFILKEVPLTPLGKIFKPRLREMSAETLIRDRLAGALEARRVEVSARHDPRGRMQVEVSLDLESEDFEAVRLKVGEMLGRLPVTVATIGRL